MNLLRWVVFVLVLASVRVFAGEPATAVATVTAGFVSGITVTSGGFGYTSEPVVTITGGGGTGATAKAILSGDRVAVVLVLTAGTGYTSAPGVAIEAPPRAFGIRLDPVFKVTVVGPPGGAARVEWAMDLAGPWSTWTNVPVVIDGAVLMDVSPGSAQRFYRVIPAVPQVPPDFVWIPPGSFMMGSPTNEVGRYAGGITSETENQHRVTLTRGFWMSDHEVTQAEFVEVMGFNPSRGWNRWKSNHPVEQVEIWDALEYCQRLTKRDRATGGITSQQAYRLPTEAEWEYAARAGETGPRYGEIGAIAWCFPNNGDLLQPVKQKLPNGWKLYDMLGNVEEMCADGRSSNSPYPPGDVTDPFEPWKGRQSRVPPRVPPTVAVRPGGWGEEWIRFASRTYGEKGGFRVVLSSVQ
jgi:hypothetical protein